MMMKFLLSCVSFLFTIVSFGQIKEKYYEQYEPGTSTKPVLTVLTIFDREGHEIKTVQSDLKENNIYVTQTFTYTYDDSGRKKRLERVQTEKGKPTIKLGYEYLYTPGGYETIERKGRVIYRLDEHGNTIRTESFFKGELQSTEEFQYDEAQRLVQEKYSSADGRYRSFKTIRYDDALNKRVERTEDTVDSVARVHEMEIEMKGTSPIKMTDLTTGEVTLCTQDEKDNVVESKTYSTKNELIRYSKSRIKYWK